MAELGVAASDDHRALLAASDVDAVVYTATADTRPMEAFGDLLACLEAGIDVVSTAFYPLLDPDSGQPEAVAAVQQACDRGGSSVFVSGIDPGWAQDILPLVLSGLVSDIGEIRIREIFNYALYDQPQVVREIIGFGGSMDAVPPMLQPSALRDRLGTADPGAGPRPGYGAVAGGDRGGTQAAGVGCGSARNGPLCRR